MGRKRSGRVIIHHNPDKVIRSAGQNLEKHVSDGEDSMLLPIDEALNMSEVEALLLQANENHEQADNLRRGGGTSTPAAGYCDQKTR